LTDVLINNGASCSRRSRDRQVDQLGKRPRAELPHGGRSMRLDGSLGDAEDVCDLLVWIAFDNHFHDLAFTRGQAGDPPRGRLAQRR
jgi:hypothetical protein